MRDNFPMPLLDDVIERLQGHNVFTNLDLKKGFFHVPIEPGSIKFISFVTHAVSQNSFLFHLEYRILQQYFAKRYCCHVYDDLIIPAKDITEGIQKLSCVLSRAAEYNMQINWKKCQFLQNYWDISVRKVQLGLLRQKQKLFKIFQCTLIIRVFKFSLGVLSS